MSRDDVDYFHLVFDELDAQLLAAVNDVFSPQEQLARLVPTMWRPFATILACGEKFPKAVAAIEDLARSVIQSSTSNMLLAQQAELRKLTAEVGVLKGALATRPVAAAPAAPPPAAPPRAPKATYASRVAQPAPVAPPAVPRVPATSTSTPRARHASSSR
ncbi:hypothetical protein AURDEDRAFT_172565 [Auricularia subglabra TFB-10046 SS5]|nr:hypothetical protein AURDEDRAFT_172565 [Auricularia subglabra TFB-10046 SS5]